MTTTPRPDQIRRQSRLIADLASRLATNPDALLDLVTAIDTATGRSGTPGPRPKGQVPDPTGATATSPDPQAARDLRRAHRAIDQAAAAVTTLAELWSTYTPSPADLARRRAAATADEPPACRAHERAGTFEAAGDRYTDLCRWCGDFRHAHGADPAPELVRRHDAGDHVTPRLIARYMPHVTHPG